MRVLYPNDPILINILGPSGTYAGDRDKGGNVILEDRTIVLRVDLVGPHATGVVSGDFFDDPEQTNYRDSFHSTAVIYDANTGVIRCPLKICRERGEPAQYNLGRLELHHQDSQLTRAVFTPYFELGNSLEGADLLVRQEQDFPLRRTSDAFRQVTLRVHESETIERPSVFTADNGANLVGTTVENAFRAAGIEVKPDFSPSRISESGSGNGPDSRWNDEELHGVLVEGNNTQDLQDWYVHLLFATDYEFQDGANVTGVMFDDGLNLARQGAAVFCNAIDRKVERLNLPEKEKHREYIYTTIHELGHTFNLLHSFQKDLALERDEHPRPAALSWMNYPRLFPFGRTGPRVTINGAPGEWDGRAEFWAHLDGQGPDGCFFDPMELLHLRHGNRADVMMGGTWAAASSEEAEFLIGTNGHATAKISLELPATVQALEQIEGYIRYENMSGRTIEAPSNLRPGGGSVDLLIMRPGEDRVLKYRSISNLCDDDQAEPLKHGGKRYAQISPNYGRAEWYVTDEPGIYTFQVVCRQVDGEVVVSDKHEVEVLRSPSSMCDGDIKKFFTPEMGLLFALDGSRSERLQAACDHLREFTDRTASQADGEPCEIARQSRVLLAWLDSRVLKHPDPSQTRIPDDNRQAADKLMAALGMGLEDEHLCELPKAKNPRRTRIAVAAAQAYARAGDLPDAQRVQEMVTRNLTSIGAPKAICTNVENMFKEFKGK